MTNAAQPGLLKNLGFKVYNEYIYEDRTYSTDFQLITYLHTIPTFLALLMLYFESFSSLL